MFGMMKNWNNNRWMKNHTLIQKGEIASGFMKKRVNEPQIQQSFYEVLIKSETVFSGTKVKSEFSKPNWNRKSNADKTPQTTNILLLSIPCQTIRLRKSQKFF
jgi:hypothetical protein